MKVLKISVISLLYGENYEAADDLVAGYITAMLRKNGFVVDIIEIELGREDKILEQIINEEYKIIVFTIPTSSNIPEIVSFCQFIKEQNQDCKIVLAGWDHHSAPIDAEKVMNIDLAIDAIIRGEGEQTILELVQLYTKNSDLSICKGLTYRKGKNVYHNPDRLPLENLDELPFPARDINYKHNYDSIRISSARGCLGNCTFCPIPPAKIKGIKPWRGRSPENVIQELKELISKFGIKHFMFVDPTFEDPGNDGKDRIRKIAELIIKEKLDIYYLVNMRAENWSIYDRDLLRLLYNSGLESITVGFEAGSDERLTFFNKRSKISDYYRFIDLMAEFKFFLAYGFIMFHPYSLMADITANNNFLRDSKIAHMMGAYLIRLKALPNTAIYKKLLNDNLITDPQNGIYTLYGYDYVEPKISRLADKMVQFEQLLIAKPECHFYNVQKFTTFAARIRRKIMKQTNPEKEDLIALENLEFGIENMKNNLSAKNYIWFSECIEWVDKNQSDSKFEQISNNHFNVLLAEYTKMSILQMKVGRKLVKYIAE